MPFKVLYVRCTLITLDQLLCVLIIGFVLFWFAMVFIEDAICSSQPWATQMACS